MTRQITLHRALDPAAPDWLHLVPTGTFTASDGRGPFRITDPQALIAASMQAGKLPLDENHATDLAAPEGRPAPARGWIVELQAREDGIWGRVEWGEAGKALVADKAYRGISPVLASNPATGEVMRILRASLTNIPSLPLKTLHHRSDPMDLTKLRAALGLPADATEAAILAAATTLHAAKAEADAAIARVAKAAGLDDKAEADKIVSTITTLHAAKAEAGEAGDLRKTVVTLQSQLDTLQAQTARDKATAYVDAAIKAGKPIKALRDHYITRHAKDPATVEKEIGAMVSIHAGGVTEPPGGGSGSGKSPDEIVALATAHQKKKAAEGVTLTFAQAVRAVTD